MSYLLAAFRAPLSSNPYARAVTTLAVACVVAAWPASPAAAAPGGELRACVLDLCEQECRATLQEFLDACDFCQHSENCETAVCQESIGGCLPLEDCLGVYEQFFQLQCAGENNQRSCINARYAEPEVCVTCGNCADECADVSLNDCDANATCTNIPMGHTCACNTGFLGDGMTCLADADGDNVTVDSDCDDNDPETYPGAAEVCDGRNNDCDGAVDEALTDTDSDTVCDAVDVCEGHDDMVDTDSDTVPDGCDVCPADAADDSDGDGSCDSLDLCVGDDASGDGDADGYCAQTTDDAVVDCDDALSAVYPGATEVCNEIDDDCDGITDSAACDVDAGVSIDADSGVTVDPDGGVTTDPDGGTSGDPDMGTVDGGARSDGGAGVMGGAGCSASPNPPSPLPWLLASALAGGLIARRRRA